MLTKAIRSLYFLSIVLTISGVGAPAVQSSTRTAAVPELPNARSAEKIGTTRNDASVIDDRITYLSERLRAAESDTRDEQKRIAALESALENEKRAREWRWLWVVTIIGAVAVLLVTAAWRYLKRRLLNPTVERTLQTAVERELETLRKTLLEKTETELISFARVLALVDASQHDAALTAFGWKDDVTALRATHPALRRAIIVALYGAEGRNEESRKSNRELAWQAVQELVAEKHDAADLRLYLMIATKLSRYPDAVTVVQREMAQLAGDKQSVTRAATIMRRVGKLDEAVKLLETIGQSDDLAVVVTRAALLRDIGRFDEAHTILLPAVQRIVDLQPERIEEDEARVINTYVANCIDRHRYDDAKASATLILEKLATIRPVEIATCGRLLVKLKDSGSVSPEMLQAYQRRITELPKDDTKTQAMVSWHLLAEEKDEAERLLREEIGRVDQRLQAGSKKESDRRNAYFFRCILGDLLLKRQEPDLASEVLMEATTLDTIGEAQFHLAKCELLRGDRPDAVRWVTQAVAMLPKWRQLAMNDELLGKNAAIMAGLKSHSSGSAAHEVQIRS